MFLEINYIGFSYYLPAHEAIIRQLNPNLLEIEAFSNFSMQFLALHLLFSDYSLYKSFLYPTPTTFPTSPPLQSHLPTSYLK
jgi:hypothetical protein